MGILSTIKSMLRGGEGGRSSGDTTPVSVERETVAESERAVKGVDEPPDDGETPGGAEEAPDQEAGEPSSTGGDGSADAATAEPVDSIKGIGTAYAERLADAGVDSVEDLAEADADELAAETGLGSGRVENWIDQARARTR